MMPQPSNLPDEGFVRLKELIGPGRPIPFCKSTLWQKVKTGEFPPPVKLGPRVTAWRVKDIREFIEKVT